MRVRPSILIIENDHALLMRYRYDQNNVYALPGGNPDQGESLVQTVVRELNEELGVEVEVEQMLLAGEVISPPNREDVLHVVFVGKIVAGIPVLNPNETTALELVWRPLSELLSLNLYPNIKYALAQEQSGYVGVIDQPFF